MYFGKDREFASKSRILLIKFNLRSRSGATCGLGRIGVRPSRVSIRGQKTCWGSCTGNGSISLNWRLMLLPRELAEYVLIHELCHLRFLDHSASFWALVEQWVPDFRRRRTLLGDAQHGLAL